MSATPGTATFDHVTILVTDLDEARHFFAQLGFAETRSVVISGAEMDAYMGIEHLEADHVTLAVPDAEPHQEVQLLRFHSPDPVQPRDAGYLGRVGFNHVCFRVSSIDATIAKLTAAGFATRNTMMVFHDRKLVFFSGPGDTVIELAEWL